MKLTKLIITGGVTLVLICKASSLNAQLFVKDLLTGTSSNYAWQTFGDTCLTAGDGSPSSIPACTATNTHTDKPHVGGVNGQLPDPVGQGALRLTNDGNLDLGRPRQIVSTQPFSATSGIQVTFTKVTYGGNG